MPMTSPMFVMAAYYDDCSAVAALRRPGQSVRRVGDLTHLEGFRHKRRIPVYVLPSACLLPDYTELMRFLADSQRFEAVRV